MLFIQKYIIEHGLDSAIERFSLDHKDYQHKVLLKYKQIESPMGEPAVQECRGLVLRKSDWKVLSLAFKKFFNQGEGHGNVLDWSSVRVFEKKDGTLIHVYHDGSDICFGTTGTANGEGPVDNFHWSPNGDKSNGTFADLFWKAFLDTTEEYFKNNPSSQNTFEGYANKRHAFAWWEGYTLAFELCTPHNIVVTPHENYRVYLLGMRNLNTMEEVSFEKLCEVSMSIGVPLPDTYEISNPDDCSRMVATQPFSMEGVVACDANFNRRKIKNPAYVAIHYMREATAYWRIIDIVRSGEIDEYLAYFPGRKDEVMDMKAKWDRLNLLMSHAVSLVSPLADKLKSIQVETSEYLESRKQIAAYIIGISKELEIQRFNSYIFGMLGNSRVVADDYVPEEPQSLSDYLLFYDGWNMYDILKKWKL